MEPIIKTYPNGLRLVVNPMQNFKSVAFSMLVMVGSGDEQPQEYGLSHYCEHMLFKGTKQRSGQQIIDELSMLSVDYNAWTSEDATCYHTKGIADNLEQCVDIFSDMYFNSQFTREDFDKEGDVIVQEIAMHEDSPMSVLFDQLNTTYFRGTKYEHPVAGYAEAIKRYQPDDVYHYLKKHYIAPNTIIGFAGDISLARAEALVAKYFLPYFAQNQAAHKVRVNNTTLRPVAANVSKKKDTEQQHVALVFPACNQFDRDRHALKLLKLILGGDMSSRLFINVREKLGLVYSISAGVDLSDIGGYFVVLFSCTPKNTKKVIEVTKREIANLLANGVQEQELIKVRNFCHVQKLFQAEKTVAVNESNVTKLASLGEIMSAADELALIDGLTVADLNQVAQKYLNVDLMTTVVVGK